MNEKNAVNDSLSSLNSMITLLNYSIEQSNNMNFRNILINNRNDLENLQWGIYQIAKENGYYIPAAPAGQSDIDEVKNAISQ